MRVARRCAGSFEGDVVRGPDLNKPSNLNPNGHREVVCTIDTTKNTTSGSPLR